MKCFNCKTLYKLISYFLNPAESKECHVKQQMKDEFQRVFLWQVTFCLKGRVHVFDIHSCLPLPRKCRPSYRGPTTFWTAMEELATTKTPVWALQILSKFRLFVQYAGEDKKHTTISKNLYSPFKGKHVYLTQVPENL